MTTATAPDRTEAAEDYFTYIEQVPAGDIRGILKAQLPETVTMLKGISEERSLHRYAPDKWSIREVVSHLNDTERLFVFRALWFARGFDSPLPSFDQNVAIATADADARSLESHIEEFRGVRAATIAFFENLPEHAWMRRGHRERQPVYGPGSSPILRQVTWPITRGTPPRTVFPANQDSHYHRQQGVTDDCAAGKTALHVIPTTIPRHGRAHRSGAGGAADRWRGAKPSAACTS